MSAVVRFLLALSHPTPLFFADEYIYSTLAHELATTGRPTIRGDAASFPALLEPILTAPFWLFGDAGRRAAADAGPERASRCPSPRFRSSCSPGGSTSRRASRSLPRCSPSSCPTSSMWRTSSRSRSPTRSCWARSTWAYGRSTGPRAGTRLASWRSPGWRLSPGSSSSCSRSRSSLAALIARTGLRRLKLTFGLFALAAIPVAAKGVGYYSGIADFHVDPGALVHWFAVDSMLLAYAAGWLVIPGALVVLARPRPGVERAFAALTVCFAAGLFLEAVLFATNADRAPGGRFQERYLFTLIPLLLLAFGLSLGRGGRVRGAIAVIAAVLVAVSARFPLCGLGRRPRAPGLAAADGRLPPLRGRWATRTASFLAAAAVALLAGCRRASRLPASVRHAGPRRDGRPARACRRTAPGRSTRATRSALGRRTSPLTPVGSTTRTSATSPS